MEKKNYKSCLGIDVSKGSLNCCLFDRNSHENYKLNKNDYDCAIKVVKKLKLDPETSFIVMEATGCYYTSIFKGFFDLGFEVAVVNPLKIKRYAQEELCRVKTDFRDAIIIAEFGMDKWVTNKLTFTTPRTKLQEEMILYLKAKEDLQLEITRATNRLEALNHHYYGTKKIKKHWERVIKVYNKSIEEIDGLLEKMAKSFCSKTYKLLRSIPGVGAAMNILIIAYFGKFDGFENAKKVVSYAGINPQISESGTSVKGKGSISRMGNKLIRKIAYLCALSASSWNKSCKDLYVRLLERGKKKKEALVAVAAKLLRQIFGVVKNGQLFNPDHLVKI